MNSAVVAETFSNAKKSEYIRFAEKLGADVCFTSDKWICDTLRRSPAEKTGTYTLYFDSLQFILEEAGIEAARLKAAEIGTEHMLLAVLNDIDCVACRILQRSEERRVGKECSSRGGPGG